MRHPNLILAAIMLPMISWSAYQPYEWPTWWMEVIPVFIGFIALAITHARQWRFSHLALTLIGLHMVILLVGGHYTYARVPIGNWACEAFGFTRNHYDRLGHLAQGFIPAILCREVLLRNQVVLRKGWLAFLCVCFCLAFSATYELIEMAAALCSADGATEFLGTQGDPWDTQWDMLLAGIGAITAILTLSGLHDRSIRSIPRIS